MQIPPKFFFIFAKHVSNEYTLWVFVLMSCYHSLKQRRSWLVQSPLLHWLIVVLLIRSFLALFLIICDEMLVDYFIQGLFVLQTTRLCIFRHISRLYFRDLCFRDSYQFDPHWYEGSMCHRGRGPAGYLWSKDSISSYAGTGSTLSGGELVI